MNEILSGVQFVLELIVIIGSIITVCKIFSLESFSFDTFHKSILTGIAIIMCALLALCQTLTDRPFIKTFLTMLIVPLLLIWIMPVIVRLIIETIQNRR